MRTRRTQGMCVLPPLAFCLLPLVVGCTADLGVPSEAQVACASSADCPSGWTCNQKVGRCVKTENIDSTAPALVGDGTVTPTVLKRGAKATVSFSVSEDLATPPVVTLSAGTDRLLTPASSLQPPAYSFTYTAVGDEPQNIERPVSIVLTDKSGNESGKLSGGSLKFDFIAPEIPADKVTITGSPAKKDGVVTVKFSVSEPLVADPVVSLSLNPQPLTINLLSSSGLDFVYTYTVAGTESEELTGVGVTVELADKAGNAASVALEN